MARLSIYLLGPLRVLLEGQPVTGFESDKARALLAYLAAEPGRPHRREFLAGLLWPDRSEKSARACLRSTLANLRKVIDEAHINPPCLIVDRQTISFNPDSDVWVDVKALSELLGTQAYARYPIERLGKAVEIYQGRFLEEFFVPCSAAFEEWALLHRERLHRRMAALLQRLAAYYENQDDQDNALRFAWRLVELDPWREESQRDLMRLLALTGQRAAALAQYQVCRSSLTSELGVEPAIETTILYEQIRDGNPVNRRGDDPGRAESGLQKESLSLSDRTSVESRENFFRRLPVRLFRARAAGVTRLDERMKVGEKVLSGFVLLFGLIAIVSVIQSGVIPVLEASSQDIQPGQTYLQPFRGKVVFVCEQAGPQQICISDTLTDKITRIPVLDFAEIGSTSWSPDGEKILFCAGRDAGGWFGHHLYTVNSDGSNLRQIQKEGYAIHPVWSPDGDWIAFVGEGGLWLMRPDGSDEHMLVTDFDWGWPRTLSWSPDSQEIAYVNIAMSGYAEAWTIQPDGQELSKVDEINGCFDTFQIGWSADGRQVGVYCLSPDKELFFVANADGTGDFKPVAFLDDWFHYYWPRWEKAQ